MKFLWPLMEAKVHSPQKGHPHWHIFPRLPCASCKDDVSCNCPDKEEKEEVCFWFCLTLRVSSLGSKPEGWHPLDSPVQTSSAADFGSSASLAKCNQVDPTFVALGLSGAYLLLFVNDAKILSERFYSKIINCSPPINKLICIYNPPD